MISTPKKILSIKRERTPINDATHVMNQLTDFPITIVTYTAAITSTQI